MVEDDTMRALCTDFADKVFESSALHKLDSEDAEAVRASLTSEPLPWHQATIGMMAHAVGGEDLHAQTTHGLGPLVDQARRSLRSSDFEHVASRFIALVLQGQQRTSR